MSKKIEFKIDPVKARRIAAKNSNRFSTTNNPINGQVLFTFGDEDHITINFENNQVASVYYYFAVTEVDDYLDAVLLGCVATVVYQAAGHIDITTDAYKLTLESTIDFILNIR